MESKNGRGQKQMNVIAGLWRAAQTRISPESEPGLFGRAQVTGSVGPTRFFRFSHAGRVYTSACSLTCQRPLSHDCGPQFRPELRTKAPSRDKCRVAAGLKPVVAGESRQPAQTSEAKCKPWRDKITNARKTRARSPKSDSQTRLSQTSPRNGKANFIENQLAAAPFTAGPAGAIPRRTSPSMFRFSRPAST